MNSKIADCFYKGIQMALFGTAIIAGVSGVRGNINSNLLAKISLATNTPLLTILMVSQIKHFSENKRKMDLVKISLLTTQMVYYLALIVLSILALKGLVTSNQLGWTIIGPILSIIGLSTCGRIYSTCCKKQ